MESYWNKMSQDVHEAQESSEQIQEPYHIRSAQARAEMEADEQGQDNAEDARPNSREVLSKSQDNGSMPKPPEAQNDLRNTLNEIREREIEITTDNIDSIAQTVNTKIKCTK